jgi:hypothetical protein
VYVIIFLKSYSSIPHSYSILHLLGLEIGSLDALDDLLGKLDPVQMAKGDSQNIDNEYSRAAKASGMDPCDWLTDQYEEARRKGDPVAARKIQQAQKFLKCRNKRKRNCD